MPVYTLPDLPYDYAALAPVISPEIIELHHDKHHAAYVKGANDTLEQLAEARDNEQWGSVNGLEKSLAFHLSGHVLHSIYWHNMTGDGGGEPLAADGVGGLADAITDSFGSFAGFKAQLTKAAATTQGSGWGVLAHEPLSGRLIVEQVYDHQGNVGQGSTPSWSSTPGSTPSTSSTRTRRSTSSTPCGRSSTGRTWPGVTTPRSPAGRSCPPDPSPRRPEQIVLPRDRLLNLHAGGRMKRRTSART